MRFRAVKSGKNSCIMSVKKYVLSKSCENMKFENKLKTKNRNLVFMDYYQTNSNHFKRTQTS